MRPIAYLGSEIGLRSLLIGVFVTFVCMMNMGCDKPTPVKKSPQDLLNELSQVDTKSSVDDDKTIAAQAEKLLSNKPTASSEDSDTTNAAATPQADEAILVIDSIPDKPQQSLPVEDDNSTPWMFDPTKPLITWEVIYRGNVPMGYTSKKSIPNSRGGSDVISTDFLSVLRFVKDGVEVRRQLDIKTEERINGELVNLTSRSQMGSETQMFVIKIDGNKAEWELTANKNKQKNSVEWDQNIRGPFAIEQSMMRKPIRDNESRLVRFFDPLSGRIVESRLDAQTKYKSPVMLGKSKLLRETKVTTRDGSILSQSTIWSDEDGVILKSYVQSSDLRFFQVNEETYNEVENAFDLSFSENRSLKLEIKPEKTQAFLAAMQNDDQITYRFRHRQTDPYTHLSNRTNQRKKSLDAFNSDVTVFRLTNREQLPIGIDSLDKPIPSDLELSSLLDSNNPLFEEIYKDELSQVDTQDGHLKVSSAAIKLSEKYESVRFNNEIRKLSVALNTSRLNSVEHSMALIALLRKEKIPSRMALGYAYDQNTSEPTMIFKAWVEYHYGAQWWPIDPTFPTKTGLLDRIKMKEIRSFSSDVHREITKVLEFGNEGSIVYQD